VSGTDVEVGRNLRMKDAGGTGTLRTIVNYDAVNDLRISTGTTAGSRSILLQTEGADQLKVDASGNVTALTGNLVIGTAGKGIDFSADPSAAGMTSELLDDYEEGTCTITMTPLTSGTITLNESFKTLRYTKIGRLVTLTGLLNVLSVSSPVGPLVISGFPFTSVAGSANSNAISVAASGLAATAITSIVGFVNANATSATLYKYASGGITNLGADVQASASFYLTITYTV
jgi:hypothetical protein